MKILDTLAMADFEQMQRLEQRFYGSEYITPAAEAWRWYRQYPYTVLAAADGGRIKGFINLFPVTGGVQKRLLAGTFNDSALTAADIVDIRASETEPLHLFLSCIAAEPDCRGGALSGLLLRAAARQYAPVSDRCDVILTDNVTAAGERFSQRYGFRRVCATDHASTVYAQSWRSFLARLDEIGPGRV